METEKQQLLLKDLCARLSYGVFCEGITMNLDFDTDKYYDHKVKGMLTNIHHYKSNDCVNTTGIIGLMNECELETIKPYLFPMSSMTEEQKKEFIQYAEYDVEESVSGRHYEYYLSDYVGTPEKPICNYNAIDWLNAHHFDYRGLIEKGLAIDATNLNIY